jgi:hypothetical protein
MKSLAHTFRCLLVALTATSVMASPVTAHAAAGCKNDGVKVSSHHHPKCCCGTICRCARCPGADSGKHTPPPAPAVPDDGRVVVKIHAQAIEALDGSFSAPEQIVECMVDFFVMANLSSSLFAQHTCLRV